MSSGAGSRWLRLTIEYACINGMPGAGNHLEIEFVAVDLDQHEPSIGIKSLLHLIRRLEIVSHQLGGVSQNKVIDVVMRLDPFVNVFVARKNQVHAVFFKKWSELGSQVEIGAMRASIVK